MIMIPNAATSFSSSSSSTSTTNDSKTRSDSLDSGSAIFGKCSFPFSSEQTIVLLSQLATDQPRDKAALLSKLVKSNTASLQQQLLDKPRDDLLICKQRMKDHRMNCKRSASEGVLLMRGKRSPTTSFAAKSTLFARVEGATPSANVHTN